MDSFPQNRMIRFYRCEGSTNELSELTDAKLTFIATIASRGTFVIPYCQFCQFLRADELCSFSIGSQDGRMAIPLHQGQVCHTWRNKAPFVREFGERVRN